MNVWMKPNMNHVTNFHPYIILIWLLFLFVYLSPNFLYIINFYIPFWPDSNIFLYNSLYTNIPIYINILQPVQHRQQLPTQQVSRPNKAIEYDENA